MKKFIFKLYIAALIIFPFSNLYSTHSQENSPVSVRASSQEDDLSLLAGIMSADQPSWLYTSDLITSEIPAWMIALKISLYTPSAVDYRLSYQSSADNITWSAWHPLYLSEREADDLELFTDPYGLDQQSSYFHYQIQVAPDNQTALSNIKNVKLVALDPTDPAAQINSRLVAPAAAQEEFNVITRTEWGADESIMFWDEDMEHEAIDQIVLHHTATNDNSPLDPEATIRGIYYYHTVDRGWGDIGYNYIVDQHGNIYEGRKGGLGSVAAHAEGFNSGSVGISVLGNYEEVAPVQDSQGAVANIISFVSYQTNLDLEGTVEINGKTYPTVVGHRDVNATSCPGAKYYELIPDVIEQAIADSQNDGPKTFDAEFVDQSDYQ
ncbi:MAG: N-acetylmuramoyl-L-alanine amidase, partial [Patescibacteria group bacterium]